MSKPNSTQANAEAPLQEGKVLNHARDGVRVQRAYIEIEMAKALFMQIDQE